MRSRSIARRPIWSVGVAALVAILLSLMAVPLAAQAGSTPDGSNFEVLRVDLTGDSGTVAFRPAADAEETASLEVEIEGTTVSATQTTPLNRSSVDAFTIMVVDDSETADDVAGFASVQSAALAYLEGLPANTRVMLVRAGGSRVEIRPEVRFTADHGAVREAINGLVPEGGAVTWNAISDSTAQFFTEPDGVRNVVVFAASEAGASSISPNVARGNLLTAGSALTVIAPEVRNLDLGDFEQVVSTLRGSAIYRGDAERDIVAMARLAADVEESHLVSTFDTSAIVVPDVTAETAGAGTTEISVSHGGSGERVRIVQGGVAAGEGLVPPALVESSRFGVLSGGIGVLLAVGLGVLAVLLFSFSMFQIISGEDNTLNSTLSVYGAQDQTEEEKAAGEAFRSQRSKIIEQVVEKAEEAAAARGNLGSTTTLLEKAEIPLRVGEAFAIQVGAVLLAFVLGFLISRGNPIVALIFAVPAAIFPVLYVKFKVSQRARKLEAQLPDTLNLLASTLKAGYSFIQGIDAVGNEAEEPLAGEFRRTVNEARLGKELDLALDDLAERVGSIDLLWAVVAIKIQREVGGNLAELLSTVADTMTARSRLRGEVRSLTAEGRASAGVLLLLPFGVGFAMYLLNPEYIATLWMQTLGLVAVGGALFSMLIGGLWMRKIIDINI